jgi:hypothetical protein
LAPQLRLPQSLFDWRTEANASGLWTQSMEMIEPFRAQYCSSAS